MEPVRLADIIQGLPGPLRAKVLVDLLRQANQTAQGGSLDKPQGGLLATQANPGGDNTGY